jgi:uncharacterized protein (TIGR02145 family)
LEVTMKLLERLFLSASLLVIATFFLMTCSKDKSTKPDQPTTPVVTTASVSAIMQTTAQCGGTITADGGATVTARGVCWSTNQTPTVSDDTTADGTGTGSFTSNITGLTVGTTYYVRAYATNTAGTSYGDEVSFGTTGTVTDIDGNVYQTVKIGDQWWMAENLKVTHYRNGDTIPNVTDPSAWNVLTTGAYCAYDNNIANVAVYGRLYNWFAVDDSRNMAPAGWHVPTDAEWQTLVDYLGGGAVAGGKMKEAGTAHWANPNTGATNESGFTGLPGGGRGGNGPYSGLGNGAGFWTSTENEYISDAAWNRNLTYNHPEVIHDYSGKKSGVSVRCVKD